MTLEQLRAIMPRCNVSAFLPYLNPALDEFGIDTTERIAMFLAQVAHESSELCQLSENLNYSIAGLMKTWPARFQSVEFTNRYAHMPEKIANYVYADRNGNGDEASGDGFMFRGAGGIQLTGRDAHTAFSSYSGVPLDAMPAWLVIPEGAIRSACWFWQSNGLNTFADTGNFVGVTRRINGGIIGLADRLAYLDVARTALA